MLFRCKFPFAEIAIAFALQRPTCSGSHEWTSNVCFMHLSNVFYSHAQHTLTHWTKNRIKTTANYVRTTLVTSRAVAKTQRSMHENKNIHTQIKRSIHIRNRKKRQLNTKSNEKKHTQYLIVSSRNRFQFSLLTGSVYWLWIALWTA